MAILSTLESTTLDVPFKMVHFHIKTQNLDLVNLKCAAFRGEMQIVRLTANLR